MHLELAPPSTAPPRRLINASQANGLAWSVWRELDDFLFEVSPLKARADDPPTVALYTSPADFSTAHKAERAAKAWCEAYVPMPHRPGERADFVAQAQDTIEAPPSEVVRRAEVSGWLIEVTPSARGGYNAGLIDLATGEVGPEQPDCESSELALDAARTWAGRNSTKVEQEDQRASQAMDAALAGDDMSTPFDGPGDITTELVLPPDLDAAPALAQLEAEDSEAAKVLADAVAARDAKLAPPTETPPAPSRDEELEELEQLRYGGWLAVLDMLVHATRVRLVPITTSEIHATAGVKRARTPKLVGDLRHVGNSGGVALVRDAEPTAAELRAAAKVRRDQNKLSTIEAAWSRGWAVEDDNEAEACFCGAAALAKGTGANHG